MNAAKQLQQQFQEKFLNYIDRHRGPLSPPLQLGYRQIFILPSRFGAGFAVMLLLMTIAGLNYNNNLALLLSYLLLAIFLLVSNLAYRNLHGIEIFPADAEPVFAGQTAVFIIPLNSSADQRLALECWQDKSCDQLNLIPGKQSCLLIHKPAPQRGYITLGPWKLQSAWPFGFYRAWSWIIPNDTCLVYPAPADDPPPLPGSAKAGAFSALAQPGDDELHGLRDYQPGDQLNRIAWRSSARADRLITRESEHQQAGEIILSWDGLAAMGTEMRLSILCAWALQAENQNLKWSLKLPGETLASGSGREHLQHALRYLALFSD